MGMAHRASRSPGMHCSAHHSGLGRCGLPHVAARLPYYQVQHAVRTAVHCRVSDLKGSTPAPLPRNPEAKFFGRELLGPAWSNRARLSDDMLQQLMELPGTRGMMDLRSRADAMTTWKLALQKSTLPKLESVEWPQEPFKTKFADALRNLEMPRFTRRYPAVLNTLMRQMLVLVQDFEEKMVDVEEKQQKQKQQQQQQQPTESSSSSEAQEGSEGEQGDQGESGENGNQQPPEDMSQEMMEEAMQEAMEGHQGQQQEGQSQLNVTLEGMQGSSEKDSKPDASMAAELEKIADDVVKNFEEQMAQVVENLERGEVAFDDLNSLLQGAEGFDLSRGTWRQSGWQELDKLRKVLEKCPELRELVRQLGRRGGKGPLRRAPEEVDARGYPVGVVRSPLQPEEVRGITRSGDLSRMLPSEMALLARSRPRMRRVGSQSDTGSDTDDTSSRRGIIGEDSESLAEYEEYYMPGAHAARMLHRVRRAERALVSYDRTGWLDGEPARVTSRMEIRPAAELGPIILCLDTSGSMRGARETVAKALALECLRGAHRQHRACFLYAFSGPNEVQELELKVNVDSLEKLLQFLSCSFSGGTDVDAPLKLSLDRLSKQEWAQADILMVTDGEIPEPDEAILSTIERMHTDMGLEVHGLLVSSRTTESMKKLCTDLHVFKSWTAVGGQDYAY
mmetsp:Transcript_2638/g.4491  ORF Transcript_2638/g.4491 Transcript_2638/m.4491 type:complete len:677 (+) Transcript_2638:36-2066(+)